MIKKIIIGVFLFLALLLGFVLHLKNPHSVEFAFLFIDTQAPLGFLMLIALLVGVLLGAGILMLSLIKVKISRKMTQKKLARVEKEVKNLRSIPMKDSI